MEPANGQTRVHVYLLRDRATCIARLPRLLLAARHGDTLSVTAKAAPAKSQLVVCNLAGEALTTAVVQRSGTTLNLESVKAKQPRCVKLLKDGLLLDVAAIPAK